MVKIGEISKLTSCILWNVLGDEIRADNIEPRRELEEFSRAFITIAKLTRTPAEVIRDN